MKNMKEKLVNYIMYLAHSQRSNGYSTIMGMRKITQEIMKVAVVQCLLIPHLIHKSQCQVVMMIMKMTLHLTKIQMHRWSMEINSMIRSKSTEITGTSLQLSLELVLRIYCEIHHYLISDLLNPNER